MFITIGTIKSLFYNGSEVPPTQDFGILRHLIMSDWRDLINCYSKHDL